MDSNLFRLMQRKSENVEDYRDDPMRYVHELMALSGPQVGQSALTPQNMAPAVPPSRMSYDAGYGDLQRMWDDAMLQLGDQMRQYGKR